MTTPLSPKNTPAFFAQAAISFGVAVVAVGIGVTYLPVDRWIRGFLALGALFLVSSAFTLAKCVRDHQEDAVLSRVDQVRLAKLLEQEAHKHDPYKVEPPV